MVPTSIGKWQAEWGRWLAERPLRKKPPTILPLLPLQKQGLKGGSGIPLAMRTELKTEVVFVHECVFVSVKLIASCHSS